MSEVVAGDPGSCSALGLALHRTATRLRADAEQVTVDAAAARDGLSGRHTAALARRSHALAQACRAAADALDAAGEDLQSHATDLAEAIGRQRELVAVAASHGLTVRDGAVVQAWGITGEADAASASQRQARAADVEVGLRTVAVQVARRRASLEAALTRTTEALQGYAAGLRR